MCRVESGPRLVLRGLHVDEKRRGEGLATLLVRLWLAVADELGCGITTQAIDKPVVAVILEAAGLEPRSSKFEVGCGVRSPHAIEQTSRRWRGG